MKAIFYDRLNRREVSSEQLMETKCVRYICVGDNDERLPSGRKTGDGFEYITFDDFVRYYNHGYYTGIYDKGLTLIELKNIWFKWEDELICKYPHLTEQALYTLGYKSENCPKELNFDLNTNVSELIFLRLE